MNTPPDDQPSSGNRAAIPTTRRKTTAPPVVDKSNYTMEEMMERLKQSGGGGSSSSSGRKRKRRSGQPAQAPEKISRRTVIIISLVVAGFLGIGIWLGLQYAARIRIEGEAYRSNLNRRISSLLGYPVEFKRIFDSGGDGLTASEGQLIAPANSLVEGAFAKDITAILTSSSWVTEEWGIRSLTSPEAILRFDASSKGPNPSDYIDPVYSAPPAAKGWRMGITAEPVSISLDFIRLPSFQLEWKRDGVAATESVTRLDGHIDVARNGDLEGKFVKGLLNLDSWQPLPINSLAWSTKGTHLTIRSAELAIAKGTGEFKGEATLERGGSISLQGSMTGVHLPEFVPPSLKDSLFGKLSATDMVWNSKFFGGAERELTGKFKITGPVFRNLPFVKKISDALRRVELSHLEFPELTGTLRWTPSEGLVLKDIVAEIKDLLELRGSLKYKGDSISGEFTCIALGGAISSIRAGTTGGFTVKDDRGTLNFNVTGTPQLLLDNIELRVPDVMQRSTTPATTSENPTRATPPAPAPAAPAPAKDTDKALEELLRQ